MRNQLARALFGISIVALNTTASAADLSVKSWTPKLIEMRSQRSTRAALPSARAGLAARPKEYWLSPVTAGELDAVKLKAGLTVAGVHRKTAGAALSHGEWAALPDGRTVFRAALRSPAAQGIRIHFTNFSVGSGKVWLHDGEQDGAVAGPYTGKGPFGDGDFWSDLVLGESVIVEYEPETSAGQQPAFQIAELSHLLDDVAPSKSPGAGLLPDVTASAATQADTLPGSDLLRAAGPGPRSLALGCNLDVTCSPTWAERAKSVARYLFETSGGTALCSGALVNTRNNSGKLYFLTADHCISSEQEARSVQTFWFYQTSECNGPAPSTRNVPTTLGAKYLASAGLTAGDYALLELREIPSGVTFSGWTATDPAAGAAITGIHHPRGDYKRISFGTLAQPISSRSRPDDKYHSITWSRGVTEGGSSGSPIFNEDGLIVGMLSGGPRPPDGQTECDLKPAFDWYGRLSAAYPALQNYLEDRQVGGQNPPPQPTGNALTNNTPRQFSVGPVQSPTLFSGENAFRVEVPQGATRLEIQVRTRTPGADIDLFVRRGSAPTAGQSVQADYRSTGDTGDETVVITASSTPPLQPGTYYIALGLFTQGATVEGTVTASITGGGGTDPQPQPNGGQTLTSGQAARWSLGPVANGTLFGGANAYQIVVPQGATRLEVQLTTSTPNVDVDLFVRRGQAPAVGSDGRVAADHRSAGDTGSETIRIDNPQPGTWYIALGLITTNVQASGTLSATVTTASTQQPQPSGGALTSGTPRDWSVGPVDNPTLLGGENAFAITVPQGATRLEVRLVTTTPGADMDLFVRHGQSPAVSGNSVQSDASSESDTGNESIVLTPSGNPALRAGTYYIALALFTRGVRAEGTIVATVTTGGSSNTGSTTTLISGVSQPVNIAAVPGSTLVQSPRFQVTVPQGASRLRVQLRTRTAGVDVDLHARFDKAPEVSDSRVVADHSSAGDAGDEDLSIDSGSNPPLRPGTYYISLAVFTPNRAIEGTITAFVDTAQTAPPTNAAVLTSGTPARFSYPAQRQATLYAANSGFRVEVPEGATSLTVKLSTATQGADLDLYLRHGADLELNGNELVADSFSEGPTGQETITLTRTSNPPLKPGTYYIGVGVFARDVEVSGTVTATIERGTSGPAPTANTLTVGQAMRWSMPAVESPTLITGENAFRVDVENIRLMEIKLATDTPNADLDLYVRYGAPPEVQNGRVIADFAASSLTGNEAVTINPAAGSPMRSGTYYVALAVFTPNVATQGTLLATASQASPQGEPESSPKRRFLAGEPLPDEALVKEAPLGESVLKDKLRELP